MASYNDSVDWANKIIRLLKNQPKANEMGRQAKDDLIEMLNQDKILKDLLNLYQWVKNNK